MRTLLLADENITVQRVIALTFAQEPITVVTASDGRQAIERMAIQKPDVVLAGTSLPLVSGYELARYVRSTPELQHVPVLLLSGAFENVDRAQLVTSGANGVIEKPVEPTMVISRVKELLGLASAPALQPVGGRLITPADVHAAPKLPPATPPRPVTSTRQPPRLVEEPAGRSDYLDSLREAFDTLDQQLGGRQPTVQPPRTPPGPLGQSTTPDPRSPRPLSETVPGAANPVYEVDEEWFSDGGREGADARAGRRETMQGASPPEASAAQTAPAYEVDDEWFAEDDKARATRESEQKQLAAKIGIHDVVLPPAAPASEPQPELEAVDLPAELSMPKPASKSPTIEDAVVLTADVAEPGFASEPIARPLPIPLFFGGNPPPSPAVPIAPVVVEAQAVALVPAPESQHVAPSQNFSPSRDLANDFEALLAYEQGEHATPPMATPNVQRVTPEITGEMLEQIAATVVDRLRDSVRVEPAPPDITGEMLDRITAHVSVQMGERVQACLTADRLREAFGDSIRQTVGEVVRQIVSETSERLVREEIERIKSQAQQS